LRRAAAGAYLCPVRLPREIAFLLLLPAAFGQVQQMDPVTVSATRAPTSLSQSAFTVEVVPEAAFDEGPAMSADEALQEVPDFSLFRRNSSMTANPTSQGVSLRGLGPSGASRSLVLLDGVPLNDPFGGWVPWSLVPMDSIAGAEIVPGGGASAWGNEALAGVIQIFSKPGPAARGSAVAEAGDFDTRSAELQAAYGLGPGVLELRGQDFATSGFGLISPSQRGAVDVDAASRHESLQARWEGSLGAAVQALVTLREYQEWRDNGTAYQQNRLNQQLASAVLSGSAAPGERWTATAYVQAQSSSQTFSSVNAARTAETPASDQFAVPADALGLEASSTWTDSAGAQTTLGADLRQVRGETREDFAYASGSFTEQRDAGGRQAFAGMFAERTQPLGPQLHATAAVRLDRWEDSDGHMRLSQLAGGAPLSSQAYPTRAGSELSPSAGLAWQASGGLELHLAAQHAFRQPTLNELYRPFRQGTTVTEANPELSTEHADSAQLGATWRRGTLRATLEGFAARLEDPVSNVTLVQGPGTFPTFGYLPSGGVGQERLNLGRVDTRGVQMGADWTPAGAVSLGVSALGENATVAEASVAPELVGKRVPEVPRWNAAAFLTWRPDKDVSLTLRVRRSGSEFDDDLNQLLLAAATVADASLRVALGHGAEAFATVDNLGNAQVQTAHSTLGVYSTGAPRLASAGLRARW